MRSIGTESPRLAAAAAISSAPPTAKGASPSATRRAHAAAISSGPTPAGSPSDEEGRARPWHQLYSMIASRRRSRM
jgi:hypothetical protein